MLIYLIWFSRKIAEIYIYIYIYIYISEWGVSRTGYLFPGRVGLLAWPWPRILPSSPSSSPPSSSSPSTRSAKYAQQKLKVLFLGPKKVPAGIWLAIQSFWVFSMCQKIYFYIPENENPSKFWISEKASTTKTPSGQGLKTGRGITRMPYDGFPRNFVWSYSIFEVLLAVNAQKIARMSFVPESSWKQVSGVCSQK